MQAIWSGGRSGFQGMNEEGSQPVPAESIDVECRRLREENARLRQILAKHNISFLPIEFADRPRIRSAEVLSPEDMKRTRRRHGFRRSSAQ